MDVNIRARLLDMPQIYYEAGSSLVKKMHELAEGKRLIEACKTSIEADLALKWLDVKSNKEIRDAQVADALRSHGEYQRALTHIRALEWAISADRQRLESLRFEQSCLVAIVNNDGKEA